MAASPKGWAVVLRTMVAMLATVSYTHLGIAMGNGTAKARAAADYVTGDVARDGLMQAVDYLLSRTS